MNSINTCLQASNIAAKATTKAHAANVDSDGTSKKMRLVKAE